MEEYGVAAMMLNGCSILSVHEPCGTQTVVRGFFGISILRRFDPWMH